MAINTIITNLKTVIEAVSGIGIVHNRERFWKTEAEFLSLFKSASKINGWMITYRSAADEPYGLPAVSMVTHEVMVAGYYGMDDANSSEVTFRTLVENVCAALRKQISLSGAALQCDKPQLVSFRHALLGNATICHYAEIRMKVQELIQYTPVA